MGTQQEFLRGENCPLCGQDAQPYPVNSLHRDWLSARCGRVSISSQAVEKARAEGRLHLLSAFFRRIPDTATVPVVTSLNLDQHLAGVPSYTPIEKADRLLVELARATRQLSDSPEFDPARDYPLVVAADSGEVETLTSWLVRAGYVEKHHLSLTLEGWQRVDEMRKSGRESGRAFVAMWFDPQMAAVYAMGIEPAITDAGYEPLRIDRMEYVNSIDDEIIAGLRGSRLMVADFSGNRGGVYFEAGFMQGLGRNVFWICRKEELATVHFDVRQFNFIDYSDPADLRQRLTFRILAVEGQGPRAGSRGKPS
jgi:hypothetical protein